MRQDRRAPRVELSRNAANSHRHDVAPCLVWPAARSAAAPGPRAQAPWGGGPSGPMGPFGAHGALWGNPEAIPSGWLFRVDGYFECRQHILLLGQPDSSRFQVRMSLGATSGQGWTSRVRFCISFGFWACGKTREHKRFNMRIQKWIYEVFGQKSIFKAIFTRFLVRKLALRRYLLGFW